MQYAHGVWTVRNSAVRPSAKLSGQIVESAGAFRGRPHCGLFESSFAVPDRPRLAHQIEQVFPRGSDMLGSDPRGHLGVPRCDRLDNLAMLGDSFAQV